MAYTRFYEDWGYATECCGPLAAGQPNTPISHTALEHMEQGIFDAHVTADAAVPSTATANQLYATDSAGAESTLTYSAFGASLLDDADAAAARATLGTDDAYVNVTGDTTTGDITFVGAANASAFSTRVTGDTQDRVSVNTTSISFGSGAAAPDTNLYRSAADTLKTDDVFVALRDQVPPANTSYSGYAVHDGTRDLAIFQGIDLNGSTFGFLAVNKRFSGAVWNDNGLARTGCSFQLQNDTFAFYSFNTGVTPTQRIGVHTGGNFVVGISTTSNARLYLDPHTTPAGGIGFGADTNLYRFAANYLVTSGAFGVVGNLSVGGNVGFYGTAPVAKPAVVGSTGGNAALTDLLRALTSQGLITNNTTA